jgi:hypothetical protein
MKKLLLSISLTLIAMISFGQVTCGFIAMPEDWNFDGANTPFDYLLQIDTISNPNNIWQIGVPQKSIINSAYSSPNVIITETINHYPPNDTSVFIFKHIDQGGYSNHHSAELAGYYKVNSDSLNDYGTIEISLDKGTTWINLITDTTYSNYYYWQTEKPTLTGNSNGWQNFWVSLAELGNAFNVTFNDTILIKFTFISDSIADNLDGLAYDNFQFCDGWEGIEEIKDNNLITVYPNPTNNLLYVIRKKQPKNESVQIFTYAGQLLFEDGNFKSSFIDIKKINLPDGLYFFKYSDTRIIAIKSFIVSN